jgi:hypothetical protein
MPAARTLLLALICFAPTLCLAQAGQRLNAAQIPPEAADDQSSPFKAECGALVANWQTISAGTFAADQLQARTRGIRSFGLQSLAQRSSHHGQHYLACVTYTYAAEAAYTADIAAKRPRAVRDAQQLMGMAWMEQQMGDGKALTTGQQMEYSVATAEYLVVAKHWEKVENPIVATEPGITPAAPAAPAK